MSAAKRPVPKPKSDVVVALEDDIRVEIGVYDVLLPCRRFEIDYKVAVLGRVSPSLEFMLRLLRSAPGISEDEAAAFFGYSSAEREYVLLEATAPAYVDRIDGRLWLTSAGDALFNIGEEEPSIYEVLPRHGSVGFDLLALAPQRPQGLDIVERFLPELGIEDGEAIGKASESVRGRFRRFFHELGDRRDREQFHRRDLYSIGPVVPGDRFQAPVRIKVETLASSPSVPEVDLNSWRPDNEIADRAQIEQAAGRFVEELRVAKHTANDAGAYQAMLDLAPDFFKEFTTRAGLSVTRYWREAVTRVGEARIDRPTIAIVGPFYTQANAERLLSILDYGLRAHGQQKPPEILLSVAPQVKHWGATTQLRDTLTVLRTKIASSELLPDGGFISYCLWAGKAPKYLEKMFDSVQATGSPKIPRGLEILHVPNTMVAVLVHAPIGEVSGVAVPLGFASFDKEVILRSQAYLMENIGCYFEDEETLTNVQRALSRDPSGSDEANFEGEADEK
jgi:hypothetical protein